MPVIFNKWYAIFSKMPSLIFLLSSFNQKNWHFFGPFRSTTEPFKGFKRYCWNIIQLWSWLDRTGGVNGTIQNFFPETGKPVSQTGWDFARLVWALSRISLMPGSTSRGTHQWCLHLLHQSKIGGWQKTDGHHRRVSTGDRSGGFQNTAKTTTETTTRSTIK